jgi:outer membrane biosynthesis protein TonB
VIAFLRKSRDGETVVVVCNLTPVPRQKYRIGVPEGGFYVERMNTDAEIYGGSNMGNAGGVEAEETEAQGRPWSLLLTLPPLSTLILQPEETITPIIEESDTMFAPVGFETTAEVETPPETEIEPQAHEVPPETKLGEPVPPPALPQRPAAPKPDAEPKEPKPETAAQAVPAPEPGVEPVPPAETEPLPKDQKAEDEKTKQEAEKPKGKGTAAKDAGAKTETGKEDTTARSGKAGTTGRDSTSSTSRRGRKSDEAKD